MAPARKQGMAFSKLEAGVAEEADEGGEQDQAAADDGQLPNPHGSTRSRALARAHGSCR